MRVLLYADALVASYLRCALGPAVTAEAQIYAPAVAHAICVCAGGGE